jgi:hypothetical protein
MRTFTQRLLLVIATLFSLQLGIVEAQQLAFQGVLRDQTGRSVADGSYTMTFKLYTVQTGGSALWTETHPEVQVKQGVYIVYLGSVTSLASVGFDVQYYLGVTIGSGAEFSPRVSLSTVPYSRGVLGDSNVFPSSGKIKVGSSMDLTGDINILGNGVVKFPDGTTLNSGSNNTLNGPDNITIQIDNNGSSSSNNSLDIGIGSANTLLYQFKRNTFELLNAKTIQRGVSNVYQEFNEAETKMWDITRTGTTGADRAGSSLLFRSYDNGSSVRNTFRLDRTGNALFYYDAKVTGKLTVGADLSYMPAKFVVNGFELLDQYTDPFDVFTATGTSSTTGEITAARIANGRITHFNGNAGNGTFSPAKVSVYATDAVATLGLILFSDERIKTDIELSNSEEDLITLNRIKIQNYRHIDFVNTPGQFKKVIAQQVEEVYPLAVNRSTSVIPNIYEPVKETSISQKGSETTIQLSKAHDLIAGDKVKLILATGEKMVEVTAIPSENSFSFEYDFTLDKAFVYGKLVDDFRMVDYDAISMLNVSATQELYKRIVELESALKTNEKKFSELSGEMQQMRAQMQQILNATAGATPRN